MIFEKLETFGAVNLRDQMIWGNPNSEKKNNDKLRFTFIIEDREQALKCFRFFTQYSQSQRNRNYKNKKEQESDPNFNIKETLMIFLQKEEPIFEKYGDEEAELYEMMNKMDQQQKETRKDDDRE